MLLKDYTVSHPSYENMSVIFWFNYSEASHVLTGDFREAYSEFREQVLSPTKDYKYHPKLKTGPGWLIPKEKKKDIEDSLKEFGILAEGKQTPPSMKATPATVTYREMITTAIKEISKASHKRFVSRQAIKKYILENYIVYGPSFNTLLRKAIRSCVDKGFINQEKQSFRLVK